MRIAALIVGVAALSSTLMFAQAGGADSSSPVSFDVVSIRPNKSGDDSRSFSYQKNRFIATNVPVTTLLILAYRIPVESILNAPRWIDGDRFDVNGTFAPREGRPYGSDDHQRMLRQLLVDRFHASIREIAATGDGYALLRKGAELGPNVRVSAGKCGKECGVRSDHPGSLVARGITMQFLASTLTTRLGKTVVNRTGLDGLFDVTLDWAPEEPLTAAPRREDDVRLPIVPAVAEQLGLVLAKEPVAKGMIYVEHIERPMPD